MFILTLTLVDSFNQWPKSYLELNPESDFKTMIITIVILILTQINLGWPFQLVNQVMP